MGRSTLRSLGLCLAALDTAAAAARNTAAAGVGIRATLQLYCFLGTGAGGGESQPRGPVVLVAFFLVGGGCFAFC